MSDIQIPTFEEWYEKKYGGTFDDHAYPGKSFQALLVEFIHSTQEYIHDVLTQAIKESFNK